jgi:hypothetical protein
LALVTAGDRFGAVHSVARFTSAASAFLSLTSTRQDVTGSSVTVTAQTSSAIYLCVLTADFFCQVAGATLGIAALNVDGTDQTAEAHYNQSNVSAVAEATASQNYTGTLTAGTHTFKIRGVRSGGVDGNLRILPTHTTLQIVVFG